MYLIISTFTKIDHLTIEQAKEMTLRARGEGKRAELVSAEEARKFGRGSNMQDLTKINSWSDVK